MFLVNGRVVDFFNFTDEKKKEFLMKHHHKTMVECLCNGKQCPKHPVMFVKFMNDKYFLANHPDNNEKNIQHDFTCPYALGGYKKVIKKAGIIINKDGVIDARIEIPSQKKPGKTTVGAREQGESPNKPGGVSVKRDKGALITLFLTILIQNDVHVYLPFQQRNIAGRIYAAAVGATVNKSSLKDKLCVISAGHKPNMKHHLIIGWGNESTHPVQHEEKDFLIKIPLLSVNPHEEGVVAELTVLKRVFQKLDRIQAQVDTGYWVLWRQEDKNSGKLTDQVLAFIPAEDHTRIPVESSHEAVMVHYLVENKREFRKPLIDNEEEMDTRPDMILMDTTPATVIEVAGMDHEDYLKRLEFKRKLYRQKGFNYIEWNTVDPIEPLFQGQRLKKW